MQSKPRVDYIIVNGQYRSGSTMIWNFLKGISKMPAYGHWPSLGPGIYKNHNCWSNDPHALHVYTYRPYDQVAKSLVRIGYSEEQVVATLNHNLANDIIASANSRLDVRFISYDQIMSVQSTLRELYQYMVYRLGDKVIVHPTQLEQVWDIFERDQQKQNVPDAGVCKKTQYRSNHIGDSDSVELSDHIKWYCDKLTGLSPLFPY